MKKKTIKDYRIRRFRKLFSLIKGACTKPKIIESNINKDKQSIKQSKLNQW